MNTLLTPKQAAKLAQVHYSTIMLHINGFRMLKGERIEMDLLPVKQFNARRYLIDEGELEIFLNRYNDPWTYNNMLRKYLLGRKAKPKK